MHQTELPVSLTEPLGNETLVFLGFTGKRLGVAHAQPAPAASRRQGRHELRPLAGTSLRCRHRQDLRGPEQAQIEKVELRMVDLAPKVKRTDAIQSFVSQETPIVTITDSDGAVGTGYSYTIGTGGSSVMRLLADHLAPRIDRRGCRPHRGDLAQAGIRHPCHDDRRDHRDGPRRDRHRAVGPARQEAGPAALEACRRRQENAARSTPPRAAGCISRTEALVEDALAGQGEGFSRLQGQDRQAARR